MIDHFTGGKPEELRKKNELVDAVNGLLNMRGDGLIQVRHASAGPGLHFSVEQLLPRLPNTGAAVINYGKPTAAFSSGTTITLDPCSRIGTDDAEGEDDYVTVFVQADQASFSMPNSTTIPTTAIVPYTSSEGDNYVFGTPLEVLTDFNVNTSTFKLQKKIQVDFGLFAGTESGWIDVHTGGECP